MMSFLLKKQDRKETILSNTLFVAYFVRQNPSASQIRFPILFNFVQFYSEALQYKQTEGKNLHIITPCTQTGKVVAL